MRFGTSSFSWEDWIGPFYPPGTKPGDFLRYYATQFDVVEVDSTYYASPCRRHVRSNLWMIPTYLAPTSVQQGRAMPRIVLWTAAANGLARSLFERLGFRHTMSEMTRELSEFTPGDGE